MAPRAKMAPRWPQDGPKMAQRWPKMAPKWTQVAPNANVFPRQGPSESDFGISTKCVISMFDDIFFLKTSVFTAQGPSESDFGTSMGHAL